MSSADSKFAKSLQMHNLENLVFQKRQRKTVIQQPINNLIVKKPNKSIKLKSDKKDQSNVEKAKTKKIKSNKAPKEVPKPKKNKIIKKRKYLTSKDLTKPKKVKPSSNNKTEQNLNKTIKIEINKSKINQNQKQIPTRTPKKNEQKKIAGISSHRITRSQKQQQKIDTEIKKQEKQQIEKKQEQIIKIPKKLGRPRKIIFPVQQNPDQKYQNKQQNSQKVDLKESPIKNRSLANILQNSSKKELQGIDQTPKPRQAKLNALKKYTEKDIYPQEQFQFERNFSSSKRKKIYKINKTEQYSINRIFRKQPKLQLNPINIQVKLDLFNMNTFQSKFGTFDIIHCSLPLSMIWEMPSIQKLMVKGFIFIWVEKGETSLAYHLMKRLGYDVIDQIVWVKCDESTRTVFNEKYNEDEENLSQNNLFLNSKSVCFVGYKCPSGQKAEYRTKISNNLIFSCPKLDDPLKKPDQIYQIADLLMPGSKKLQLGGRQQNGWLSLHHNQLRLRKCTICLCQLSAQNKARLFRNENLQCLTSICSNCYEFFSKEKGQNSQENQDQNQQNQLLNVQDSIMIKNIGYLDSQVKNQCYQCKQTIKKEQILCSCNLDSQKLLCKECFNKEFSSHQKHFIQDLNIIKDTFIPTSFIECSKCNKNTLASHFYQCVSSGCRTKNHILCQQCFWKQGYQMIRNQSQLNESKRKKNDGLHEFRFKKILAVPEQKVSCSCECQKDLQLPHFVCQTCVGWRWCGKCKINYDETHQINLETNQNPDGRHLISLIY